jgi:probable phosphoglycerate mutase
LILVRHAHHDPDGRFLQHECRGLTPTGLKQARRLAAVLAAFGSDSGAPAVVLSSRAARAEQTADIVASALGVPVQERTCDLCEMHPGAAEGLTPAEMEARYGPSYASVPGAEHFPDWLPSAIKALHRVVERYGGSTIIAVTHTAVVKASFRAFADPSVDDVRDIRPGNTGITEWVGRPGATWHLERYDDLRHLRDHGPGVA